MAGMHLNPFKYLQECGDGNLDNFLTARIIVSSVGGQASTWMKLAEPIDFAAKWGIGLEVARCTLKCKNHRGLRTVLHPSLSQRSRMNDQQLRYRRLQRDVLGDTFLALTKSKRGNKYVEVFVTNFGWLRAFPMAKNGDAHKALSLLFQRDGVPLKMIFDVSKENTLEFLNVRLKRLDVT